MKIKILTLFPKMFDEFMGESIIKRAIDKGVVEIEVVDFRLWSQDKHHHVDDTPCSGGAGMVLRPDILIPAIKDNSLSNTYKILMTPQGRLYKQDIAQDLSKHDEIMLICGHYEGFDERIREYVDDEISIGDYVLTGGELASMVVSDSIIRLLNDAIKKESHEDDSFQNGLLEYPQYTRPIEYDGKKVPDVLLCGNHKDIRRWRLKESLRKTMKRRPDLLLNREFSKEELELIDEIKEEEDGKK